MDAYGDSSDQLADQGDRGFGSTLDWDTTLVDVTLIVELPFWLMLDDCLIQIEYQGATLDLALRDRYVQLHAGPVLESRQSLVWQGPEDEVPALTQEVQDLLSSRGGAVRLCRSSLRLQAAAHMDVFAALSADGSSLPRRAGEAMTYLATLCEAHIPIVNELIQRYRLATYDYFPYLVAPWDVPIWSVVAAEGIVTVPLLEYARWDRKPVIQDQEKTGDPQAPATAFRYTDAATLVEVDPGQATPGEFDLLDARSLLERGDYSGAVRRSVTAIEAVVEHALRQQLCKTLAPAEANQRLAQSQNDFPGRYRQWKKLTGMQVIGQLEAAFESTRATRHRIVHQAHRLTHEDRGLAQKSVDTARWLFNVIEGNPDRAQLREKPNTLREVGRAALSPRFRVIADAGGVRVAPPLSV